MSTVHDVVILGSGPCGLTAALYAARAQLKPVVYHGNLPGGQLTTTTEVENFPGFPEGVDGNELLERMTKQAQRFGAKFEYGEVSKVTPKADGVLELAFQDGETPIQTRTLIVATGARPRKLLIPSETAYWGKGVTSCATCDGFFYKGMDVCVIGGGDSAMEEAQFLTRMCTKVYLIHRRDKLRASKIMADRALANEKIEFVWNSEIDEIVGDGKATSGIRVKNVNNGETRLIPLKGVFLALGHLPNTDFLEGLVDRDDQGYVITQGHSTATKVPGLFVAGDCQDHIYRQAVTAAGSGCMASIEAERYLDTKKSNM